MKTNGNKTQIPHVSYLTTPSGFVALTSHQLVEIEGTSQATNRNKAMNVGIHEMLQEYC